MTTEQKIVDRIEYPNKVRGDLWTSANANEVKQVVNENANALAELSAHVKENKEDTASLSQAVISLREETKVKMVGQTYTITPISPNALNVWGEVESLNIWFRPGTAGIVNEYMMQFTVSGNAFSLNFHGVDVRWVEEPDYVAGNTYMVSVVNNLAIGAEWSL